MSHCMHYLNRYNKVAFASYAAMFAVVQLGGVGVHRFFFWPDKKYGYLTKLEDNPALGGGHHH